MFRPAVEISPRILGLTSGAGGEITGEIAPGEIVSNYGTGIGPERPAGFMLDENGRVPTILSGVRVFFGDLPAPLLYASRNQIHAIVPNGVQPRSSVAVRVSSGLPPFTAQVFPSAPALFGDQDGHMVRNQDGFPNHAGNPAPAGSVVALWMTGTGADSQPDGTVASGPRDTKCCTAMYQQTPLEVHKLPNGTIALVGYGAADTAARIATGRGALKFRLQPSPREGESTLVSVPMWRVRRCKENSTRDGNGLELELLDPS